MNTRRTRIIIGLVVLAALGYYFFLRSKPLGPMGEVVSPDEDYLTAQIVASALSMVNASHHTMAAKPLPGNPPGTPATTYPTATAANAVQPYRRDVHAKTYGCVKATFRVLENLDPKYRQGIFADSRRISRVDSLLEWQHPGPERRHPRRPRHGDQTDGRSGP